MTTPLVSFSYTVSDGTTTVPGSATLDLTPVNDAPVAPRRDAGGDRRGQRCAVWSRRPICWLGATDVDHDTLSVSDLSASSGTLVDNHNGTWTFTPAGDDDTSVSFSYTVSDGTTTVPGSATLDLTPVNDAPVASAVTLAAIAEDSGAHLITTADLLAGATDVDHDTLSVSGLSASSGTLVDNHNGTWTFTPAGDDDTSVSFSYTVSDGTTTVPGGATLDLTPVNDAPVAPVDSNAAVNSVAENAANGTPVGITAQSTDVDGDAVTYSLVDDAGGRFAINSQTGVVTVANGTLLDFETATSHTITVKAADASGAFSTQNFTIGVSDVNEGPVNHARRGGRNRQNLHQQRQCSDRGLGIAALCKRRGWRHAEHYGRERNVRAGHGKPFHFAGDLLGWQSRTAGPSTTPSRTAVPPRREQPASSETQQATSMARPQRRY